MSLICQTSPEYAWILTREQDSCSFLFQALLNAWQSSVSSIDVCILPCISRVFVDTPVFFDALLPSRTHILIFLTSAYAYESLLRQRASVLSFLEQKGLLTVVTFVKKIDASLLPGVHFVFENSKGALALARYVKNQLWMQCLSMHSKDCLIWYPLSQRALESDDFKETCQTLAFLAPVHTQVVYNTLAPVNLAKQLEQKLSIYKSTSWYFASPSAADFAFTTYSFLRAQRRISFSVRHIVCLGRSTFVRVKSLLDDYKIPLDGQILLTPNNQESSARDLILSLERN